MTTMMATTAATVASATVACEADVAEATAGACQKLAYIKAAVAYIEAGSRGCQAARWQQACTPKAEVVSDVDSETTTCREVVLADAVGTKFALADAIGRARQREGRGGSLAKVWRPRVDIVYTPKQTVLHDPRRLREKAFARGSWVHGCKTNNERGAQCQGQGKRHQNRAVHAIPSKQSGKKHAKWA